ncbi:fumarylacetoacetate hydrolase family protein [Sphingomonas sp. SRS2]|uniref:fumarylacetoacetate hydrolase family protein n=1 Tax=Sphingomonas sp. SRS2 TaxID=133190 RepID=UPI00061847E1|nr:fumarylacetoacetate hydrolase family protein [Sphingomonas sp. SRS2]KKC26191.1 5-carboxymethyl-2-hydroxymuconate isomerase [Sphingomonas sp. SRS2]
MKLVTFSTGEKPKIGIVRNDVIHPIEQLAPDAPAEMIDLIAEWDRLSARLSSAEAEAPIALADARLLPPILKPGKILAIGLNYRDHIEEVGMDVPTEQLWFCKQPTAANGPFAPVELPRVAESLDYEVELVVVIGKRGRHIARDDARNHVFGYAVGNDFTARDWQFKTSQWVLGKSFDTHAPFGPWILSADEIEDPHTLDIRCTVNGELRQSSNTRHLLFDIWTQIEHLSEVMTLEPGDLIFSGTPGGVGMGYAPPKFLSVGDQVRCEIEQIGAIENLIVAEAT